MGSAVSNIVGFALPVCATPTLTPPPADYGSSAQSVVLACSTPSSSIFYTTDGSTPTPSSTPYSGPISVSSTETLLCMATAAGFTNSAVAGGLYTITPPAFVLSGVMGQHILGGHLFNDSNLSWNAVPGTVNFKTYRQINGGGFTLFSTQLASGTTYAPGVSQADSGLASTWVYGPRDYYVEARDGSNVLLATSNTITLPWPTPVNTFQITAGSQTLVHEFDGYCNALAAPNLSTPMGSILPAGASILGLLIDSFFSDAAPFSGPTLSLHGASGSETFTLTFTDANADNQVLTSAAANKVPYTGGMAFEWFVSGNNMFIPGASYLVTVS